MAEAQAAKFPMFRHAIRGMAPEGSSISHESAMSTRDADAPKFYTVSEAALLLGLSVAALRNITHPRGPLKALRIGRVIRYTEKSLRDYQNRSGESSE
jgi:hypothetical protein